MMRRTLYAVTYSWSAEAMDQIREVYTRHRTHVDQLGREGGLWLAGTLGNPISAAPQAADQAAPKPVATSALVVFTELGAAEEFAHSDPYVQEGLIRVEPVRTWAAIDYATSPNPGGHSQGR